MYSSVLKSQQGNVWYFGNFAGLSFNTSPPTAITDGQLNTFEGTSSICDDNGAILFYSDGRRIFNRNHDLMLNGDNLKGHQSSYQSSVIVPKPGSKTIFYIFTADAWENMGANGYCYSEVDMTLDGGLGAVTSNKNIFLSGPSSERLTAIRADDDNSYWVITNEWNTDIFRAYKVDCNGVNTTASISIVGKMMDEDTYCNIGTLRASPDGKRIVQTNVKGRATATPTNEYFQIFDFNDATGKLTNPKLLTLSNDGYYFGAEFSPNSKLLYIVNPFKSTIHQFDATQPDALTILASKQVLTVTGGTGTMTGIAIGPDQKMYVTTGEQNLHVINQPNVQGAGCNLVLRQQLLTSGSSLTLPNVIPNLYANRPVDFTYQLLNSCNGEVQFNASVQIPGVVLVWDFGDGTFGSGLNPIHIYGDPNAEYLVKLTATNSLNCVYEVVSKRLRPTGEQIIAGFTVTAQCNSLTAQFTDSSTTGGGQASYQWNFGDGGTSTETNPSHQYTVAAPYTVRLIVSSSSGCVADTITHTVDFTKPTVNAGPDIIVTTIDPIQLNATGATTYQWKPSTYLDNPNIANPQMKARNEITYVVTGFNPQGCSDTDTLRVTVDMVPTIVVPNAFRPSGTSNPVLRPVLRKVKALNYFEVYNRWGQRVFFTKTIDHGWDGTLKGVPQQTGTYVWLLEVVDQDGKIIRKRGSSILIR